MTRAVFLSVLLAVLAHAAETDNAPDLIYLDARRHHVSIAGDASLYPQNHCF